MQRADPTVDDLDEDILSDVLSGRHRADGQGDTTHHTSELSPVELLELDLQARRLPDGAPSGDKQRSSDRQAALEH